MRWDTALGQDGAGQLLGLEGLPEAIETVWPHTVTQTFVVHLIRACMRHLAHGDHQVAAALLKPIYTGVNEQAALDTLAVFRGLNIGKGHPARCGMRTLVGAVHRLPSVSRSRSASSSTPAPSSSR